MANRKSAQQQRARMAETIANAYEPPPAPRQYIIGNDDDALRRGIIDGTIPSTVADSGCTSGVGTSDDPSRRTGITSNKEFLLPGGKILDK